MRNMLASVIVCALMLLPPIGAFGGNSITNDFASDINDQGSYRALGGLWNPDGPKESATTHIVSPITCLQNQPAPRPSAVDNSAGLPPVGNQQSQGSCTAWAIGYYHTSFIENRESPIDLTQPENQTSPGFLYNIANGGVNEGSYMEDVADLLISNGACSMAEKPYETGDFTSWPAEDWMWVSGMKRKAISQNWLNVADPLGMDALKAHIANGNTATTGISVWGNFDNIEDFNNTYCSSERFGIDRGGHVVTICGYDDDKPTADGMGAFRMVNSWGTYWGEAGYWWMTYEAMVDGYLGYDWVMYLESELNYSPKMVAKVQIDHPERGNIIRNQGLDISLQEDAIPLWNKPFLSCYWIEDWYGSNIQLQPFPAGRMAFDISNALPFMNAMADHQFTLTMANSGDLEGTLLSFEILNAEWWEGAISWDAPLSVEPYTTVQTDVWVYPDWFIHLPIRVNGNLGMQHRAIGELWPGHGTAGDPYVIPGYYIWGEGLGNCIYIGNTTSNFIIIDCWVDSASSAEWSDYNADSGIFLNSVSGGVLEKNRATTNLIGIYIIYSTGILLDGNVVDGNSFGLIVSACNNTEICQNNVSANTDYGMLVETSFDVKVYHNNLVNNTIQAYDDTGLNSWDDGYPSGGNYWSDYSGTDDYIGPSQDIPGSDGIGDVPYTSIDGGMAVQDDYPLIAPWGETMPENPYHEPIRIDSNADFDAQHGVSGGNGTYESPWVIESLIIDGSEDGFCLYIGNTTDYFEVRGNTLHSAGGYYLWPYYPLAALVLQNTENGRIIGNSLNGSMYNGLCLNLTRNTLIEGNWGFDNGQDAILLWESDFNTITGNELAYNGWTGVDLCWSDNNIVEKNTLNWNIYDGLYMWNSAFNLLRNNSMKFNGNGFCIDSSNNNVICDNSASENDWSGIYLYNSTGCNVFNNSAFRHYYSGIDLQFSSGNFVYANKGFESEYYGLDLYKSSANIVYSNVLYSNERAGISIWESTSNYLFDNSLYDNTYGTFLKWSYNNTIIDNKMSSNLHGIHLEYSDRNAIINNSFADNIDGAVMQYSNANNICGNDMFRNEEGIRITGSNANIITNNTLALNDNGLMLIQSTNTRIYHNNFINNIIQATDDSPGNWWNDSYPSGGNYWSDYSGVDAMSGPLQNIPGSDVIGDTSYIIDIAIVDDYPQMGGDGIFIMNLAAGWNLISIPLILENNDVQDVLACIDGAWDVVKYYDNDDKNDPWKTCRQGASTNDLVELDNKKGYWVHATKSCDLIVFGTTLVSTEITLYAGWNLVAYPSLTERTVGDALWGTGADHVEVFNAVSPFIIEVGPTYMMKPGEGYWVHVPCDTVWTVNW